MAEETKLGRRGYGDGPPAPDGSMEGEAPIPVLVDAWDLYRTALAIAEQGRGQRDSAWTMIAAVALRHVFEYLRYEPVFINTQQAETDQAWDLWLEQRWSAFRSLNSIANTTKHFRLKRTPHQPRSTRREDELGYSSIYDLATGQVEIEVETRLIITEKSGSVTSIHVEEILRQGFNEAFDLIKEFCPDKVTERPLPVQYQDAVDSR